MNSQKILILVGRKEKHIRNKLVLRIGDELMKFSQHKMLHCSAIKFNLSE